MFYCQDTEATACAKYALNFLLLLSSFDFNVNVLCRYKKKDPHVYCKTKTWCAINSKPSHGCENAPDNSANKKSQLFPVTSSKLWDSSKISWPKFDWSKKHNSGKFLWNMERMLANVLLNVPVTNLAAPSTTARPILATTLTRTPHDVNSGTWWFLQIEWTGLRGMQLC